MALDRAYVVVHVQCGVISFAEPFDVRDEAVAAFSRQKAEFDYMDDHLAVYDGEGALLDEAGEEDDPRNEPE